MKKNFILILKIVLVSLVLSCNQNNRDMKNQQSLFFNNIVPNPLSLFGLLDPYPSLKSGMLNLNPKSFNEVMDFSLRMNKGETTNILKLVEGLLLDDSIQLRETLNDTSGLLKRIRTGLPDSYSSVLVWMERIRVSSFRVFYNLSPIEFKKMDTIFKTKDYAKITSDINEIASILSSQRTKHFFRYYESQIYKAIFLNQNMRMAIEKGFSAFLDDSIEKDRIVKKRITSIINQFGGLGNTLTGYANYKTGETAIKNLVINLEKHFTEDGTNYEYTSNYFAISFYKDLNYNSNLAVLLKDLFIAVKNLIYSPASLTKNPSNSIVEELSKNFNLTKFTEDTSLAGDSLLKMSLIDLKGKDRTLNNQSSQVSLLDSLVFLLTCLDIYGYEWDILSGGSLNITRMYGTQGGTLSLLDAAHALRSQLSGALGLIKVLNDSKAFTTNISPPATSRFGVKRDGIDYTIDGNTPALQLLEGESRGEIGNDFTNPNTMYFKTLPWAMNWIYRVIFDGYGPYYNVNRKNSAGEFITLTGRVYKNSMGDKIYKPAWDTSKYRIHINPLRNSPSDWAGPGGAQYYSPLASEHGSYFTIPEIQKSEEVRQVNSDEEEMYRNFQWLIYEKRFFLTIPVKAYIAGGNFPGGGQILEDAVYVFVIGNGLKGLMEAKPYCGFICDTEDNGKWQKAGIGLKTNFRARTSISNFSNIPGDSAILLEGWGYNITPGNTTFAFESNTVYQVLFNSVLYTSYNQPNNFWGAIPPVISRNFFAVERLGFLTSTIVPPNEVGAKWENRNRLLPIILALIKTLHDQADSVTNKNPYKLLSNLTSILSRPNLRLGIEQSSLVSNINLLHIKGEIGSISMRNSSLDEDSYYPYNSLIPLEDNRTLLSILIEDRRRYADGVIPWFARTEILSDALSIFSILGNPNRASASRKFFDAMYIAWSEIKLNSENPSSEQFNLESSIIEWKEDIRFYPDTRSANLNDKSWEDIDFIFNLVRTYLDPKSIYSVHENISFFLDMILDIKPNSKEITSLVDLLYLSLTDSSGNQNFILTKLLNERLPPILRKISLQGKSLVGHVAGFLRFGGLFHHFEQFLRTNHSIRDILADLENIQIAPMIQTYSKDKYSLLYSGGILFQALAKVSEMGGRASDQFYEFYDSKNTTDQSSTYHSIVNSIFSRRR